MVMASEFNARYIHRSPVGVFVIERQPDGRWRIAWEQERLGGGYLSAQEALDGLGAGHTDWPVTAEPSALGLSGDIAEWTPVSPSR